MASEQEYEQYRLGLAATAMQGVAVIDNRS